MYTPNILLFFNNIIVIYDKNVWSYNDDVTYFVEVNCKHGKNESVIFIAHTGPDGL